jgi:hypothetical protein
MQLHTLLGMEAVNMHMYCICTLRGLFVSKFFVGMKWIRGVLFYLYEEYLLFILGGGLFIVYHVLNFFMEFLLD